MRVQGAQEGEVELEMLTLKSLQVGDAVFKRVPALLYDFSDFSGHLGFTLDGILGFPLFRETVLTLDYPGSRLRLAPLPTDAAASLPPPSHRALLAFNNEQGTPFIPLQMGNESFTVLIDSGNDSGLSLNPAGLHPRFVQEPRVGTLATSVAGDHQQLLGRLAANVDLGGYTLEQPVTDLSDQLSSLGGELLKNFTVTFDQQRRQVAFDRTEAGPVRMETRRSPGLSFQRTSVYWRLLAVVPGTPAALLPVQSGDLCVRINGELVEKWNAERYTALVRTADQITFTFLQGPKEKNFDVPVTDLVP